MVDPIRLSFENHEPIFAFFIFCTIFGFFVLVLGSFEYYIKTKLYLSEVVIVTALGIILSAPISRVVLPNPETWINEFLVVITIIRLVISVQLMATALSISDAFFKEGLKSTLILLIPVLILTWGISTLLVYAIFFNEFNGLESALIGACVTPTDPILASSVIAGKFAEKRIPLNVRNLLFFESGVNDGFAYPFVILPILFLNPAYHGVGSVFTRWTVVTLLYEVVLITVIGFLIGYLFGKLFHYGFVHKDIIDKPASLAYSLALALLVFGIGRMLETDEILGVFAAGVAFNLNISEDILHQTKGANEAVDQILTVGFFLFYGSLIPYSQWVDLGIGRLIGLSILLLLFKRLPVVLAFKPLLDQVHDWKEAAFVGWFGPVGSGALLYSIIALEQLNDSRFFAVITFIILSSVIAHGCSGSPLAKLMHRYRKGRAEELEKKKKNQGNDKEGEEMAEQSPAEGSEQNPTEE